MTNFEKYKDDIIQICTSTGEIPAVLSDKVSDCEKSKCSDCLLFKKAGDCSIKFILWLYEEYIEPIKLTAKEKAFLSIVETGWIARDKSGKLHWYSEKPQKNNAVFSIYGDGEFFFIAKILGLFNFIKWEDEPYSVEEMLTWEVVND